MLLQNGNSLRYKYPSDCVSPDKYWRTKPPTPAALSRAVKEQLPTVALWQRRKGANGKYISLLAADFDTLTSDLDFARLCDTYGYACVVRSVGGKMKVLFKVEHTAWMTPNLAVGMLEQILEPQDFNLVDKSLGGLSLCFINLSLYNDLNEYASNGSVISGLNEKEGGVCIYSMTRYHSYKGELPGFVKFFVNKDTKREAFIRIILATFNLVHERGGFGLSLAVLSNQLSISVTTASRWLKELQNIKLLECTDPNWVFRKKAKIYQSCWMLTSFLREQIAAWKAGKNHTQQYSLVKGQAFFFLLQETKKFTNIDDLTSIPMINSKGVALARRIWMCHFRKGRIAA